MAEFPDEPSVAIVDSASTGERLYVSPREVRIFVGEDQRGPAASA